ncbi:MAG TPA: 2-C-methyl-D-erythritol 4-phosphate cytidylyltransferase [Candidatus Corynebacterium avicola]|uniref:2-C-methyl-D-erythritol 4-phosphate cytidylyltransferase n=1 Tax=Candidatus Corynebacterium avicola TaxID=2838527 RepID=A0A9D1UKD9_9CORY|nr:2-C-methyl-D-erythritol 4-phosphate cytidylyltransferase [Candidatus Corynebacterium avicola]
MAADTVTVYAVVAAAGSGRRLGEGKPTAFVGIAGRTILERCLDGLSASHAVDRALLSVPGDILEEAEALLSAQAVQWAPMTVTVVAGGAERVDSVLAGLEQIERETDPAGGEGETGRSGDRVLVAVHDVVRCLTPPSAIAGLVRTAREGVENNAWTGVVPVIPVTDTVKIVEVAHGGAADGAEVIRSTPSPGGLRVAQTPQVFDFDRLLAANRMQQAREELDSAHPTGEPPSAHAPIEVADDSSLMEMAGETVVVVPGSDRAFAIVGPEDLVRAERLVGDESD